MGRPKKYKTAAERVLAKRQYMKKYSKSEKYKMPWADWEKGIDFINKRSPDKVGKPDWDWIYDIRTYFVKPNYDLFFKKMDFDCKKLEETKF